jgi:hypothetical protein
VLCLHVSYVLICIALLSAGVVWIYVCALLFCILIISDVEYRILEMKQYFVHFFILLVRAINMEFFKE